MPKPNLFVFVVVDSRVNNNGEYTYEGTTPQLRQVINAATPLEDLLPQVGLIVHEFVQPMDHPPLELGSSGGSGRRLATAVPQSAKVTAAVARLAGWKTA